MFYDAQYKIVYIHFFKLNKQFMHEMLLRYLRTRSRRTCEEVE